MTVQIVRQDGQLELIQGVNRIEADEENGKRVTLYLDYCTTKMPYCDFTSIIILNN